MDKTWIWGGEPLKVFQERLREFGIRYNELARIDRGTGDSVLGYVLRHHDSIIWLLAERDVLHGIAIGLGLSNEKIAYIIEECGVPANIILIDK